MRRAGGPDYFDDEAGGPDAFADYVDHDKYGVSDVAKCESSYATEAVMQMCHGQSKCYRIILITCNVII